MIPSRADNLRARVAASTERGKKCHVRIRIAAQLPWVTTLCCFQYRIGLNEIAIEQGICDALRAERWQVFPVLAEVKGGARKAEKGALDLVAFEPATPLPYIESLRAQPWWIEVKRGDRDLTEEQLEQVRRAPAYGARVLITDEAALVRDWLKERT